MITVQLIEQQNNAKKRKCCSIELNSGYSIDWTTNVQLTKQQNNAKKLLFNWIEQQLFN